MSRRAIKAINWAALAERIPETERNAFAAFKAKSDQHLRRMAANPETPPKIDWAYYKKNITLSGLVDKFQKEYEAFVVPYPADKYTSQLEAQEKELLAQIEQFIKESNERIASASKEVERVKSLLPFSEMTMEDFRNLYPDQAIQSDKPTVWPHTYDVQPQNEKGKPVHH
ncbi:ATP synthase subunit d, mitochondrial-like [Cataglyphis hispanica]|uniref:ATP synthase subunit d, mitochondrial-like n=1 Tax=Cataglyphis hispanica TaxID=1086592 RepID=UPI00217FD4E4|nr:ATP synthase subunit d, mitochondrial-like [Cataglyphis hispanica]